jgi:hypothetical protein
MTCISTSLSEDLSVESVSFPFQRSIIKTQIKNWNISTNQQFALHWDIGSLQLCENCEKRRCIADFQYVMYWPSMTNKTSTVVTVSTGGFDLEGGCHCCFPWYWLPQKQKCAPQPCQSHIRVPLAAGFFVFSTSIHLLFSSMMDIWKDLFLPKK